MDQQITPLEYVKLGIVALVLVCGFVLVLAGKLDAQAMYQADGTMVTALVAALGISGAAGKMARARLAASAPTSPHVVVEATPTTPPPPPKP